MRDIDKRRKLTPPQIAAQFGIAVEKVVGWIKSGELRAINVATLPTGRPRWVVDIEDLAEFERQREAVPPAPKPQRRKKQTVGKRYF